MEFSTIKVQLERVFLVLQKSAESGELPLQADVAKFVQLAEKMHMNALDEWVNEAEDFLHLARQLHLAVKHERVQDGVLLLDALQDAKEYCHRIFCGHG